jgi:hypothetical protein
MREVASIWSIYLGTIDSSDNLLRAPWWTGEDEACEKTVLRLYCIPFFLMQKWYISFLPVALYSYFFIYGVRLRLWTAATNGHTVHPPDNMSLKSDGGMILTGKNRRNRRKTCPSATLSTINPHGLTRAWTWARAVRGRRLTAWAMAQLKPGVLKNFLTESKIRNRLSARGRQGKFIETSWFFVERPRSIVILQSFNICFSFCCWDSHSSLQVLISETQNSYWRSS